MTSGLLLCKVDDRQLYLFIKPLVNYSPQAVLALYEMRGCFLTTLAVMEFVYKYKAKGLQRCWRDGKVHSCGLV